MLIYLWPDNTLLRDKHLCVFFNLIINTTPACQHSTRPPISKPLLRIRFREKQVHFLKVNNYEVWIIYPWWTNQNKKYFTFQLIYFDYKLNIALTLDQQLLWKNSWRNIILLNLPAYASLSKTWGYCNNTIGFASQQLICVLI